MSLDKRIVDILFNQGLDRKTDERLVLPGRLTRLENAVFDTASVIRRRSGWGSVALTALNSGTAVGTGKALHKAGAELLIENANGLHSQVEDGALNKRTKIREPHNISGAFRRAGLSVREMSASDVDQYEMDAAFGTYVSVWVWVEKQSISSTVRLIRWQTRDERTGAVIATGTIGSSVDDNYRPRVVLNSSGGSENFEIYYGVTTTAPATTVRHRRISGSNLTTIGSETTIATTHANLTFDATYDSAGDRLYLVYKGNNAGAGDRVVHNRMSTSDGSTVSATLTRNATAEVIELAGHLSYSGGAAYYTALWRVSGGGTILWETWTADLTGFSGGGNAATGLTNPGRFTTLTDPASASQILVIYEFNSTAANLTMRVGCVALTVTGSAVAVAQDNDVARGVGIAARPYAYGSKAWLPVALLSAVQPTMFVINLTDQFSNGVSVYTPQPFVLAKVLPEEFGNLRGVWTGYLRIPHTGFVSGVSTYTAHIPCSRRSKLQYYKTTDVTVSVLADAVVDMMPLADFGLAKLGSCESNGELFLAGAQPRLYDGEQWHEAGFNYFPEITAVADTTGGGALTPSTSISVTIVYEWIDAKGRRHQSAPAVPVSVALGGANNAIQLTYSTLRLTDKLRANISGIDLGVRAVPYRTKSNGTVFYRATGDDVGDQENTASFDTLTITLEASDTDLGSGELLYTTGNILESDAWEACKLCVNHQNRIFMAGLTDPFEIRYTEEDLVVDRAGLSTNTIYTLRVPEGGGKITGLASLDDKLVVTCERMIFYFGGEGANRLGLQATFSQALVASSLFGHRINEATALIATPDGLWFHATDGFRFLNRGMQVQRGPEFFFGSEVDFYAASTACLRALAATGKRQVRFYMADATVLVYDYQFQQWSRFTGYTSLVDAAVNSDGNFVHLTSTPALFEEAGQATDNGTNIAMLLETGWLKVAGLEGFQRVYRVKVLGTYESTATFQLEAAYDYSATYQAAVSMTTGSTFSATPVQIEHHLPKQKCEAIRFRITDTNTSAGGGTRSLTGFALQVGIKKGFFKTPSSQRI